MEKFDVKTLSKIDSQCIDPDLIWTGMIKPRDVTKHLIKDPIDRAEFIDLLNEQINAIILYKYLRDGSNKSEEELSKRRKMANKSVKKILKLSDGDAIPDTADYTNLVLIIRGIEIKVVEKMEELQKKGDFCSDLFEILMSNEYDKIRTINPKEIDNKTKAELDRIYRNIYNCPGYIEIEYDESKGKYEIVEAFSKVQLERIIYNERNREKLKDYFKVMYGKDDLSDDEMKEALELIFAPIGTNDVYHLYSNMDITIEDVNNIHSDKNPVNTKNKAKKMKEQIRYPERVVLLSILNLLLKHGHTNKEIEECQENPGVIEKIWEDMHLSQEEQNKSISECIYETIEHINVDKLIMLYMYYTLHTYDKQIRVYENEDSMKKDNGHECSQEDLFQEMSKNEKYITNILKSKMIPVNTMVRSVVDEEITLSKIKNYMKNYCDGYYLSDSVYQVLVESADEDFDKYSDELLAKIVNKDQDYVTYLALTNPNAIKRLNELGLLKKRDLERLLYLMKDPILYIKVLIYDNLNQDILDNILPNMQFSKMLIDIFDTDLFSVDDYRELFSKGLISIDDIDKIEQKFNEVPSQNQMETIKNAFNDEFLLSKYDDLSKKTIEYKEKINSKNPDDDEVNKAKKELEDAISQKEEVLSLYKRFYDISKLQGDELLLNYLETTPNNAENFSKILETLRLLYEDKLITFEDILDFSGENNYIMEMLSELTFEDVNKIRQNRSIDQIKDLLDKMFSNEDISDDDKFVTLMNLFADDKTEEGRKILDEYRSKLYSSNIEKRSVSGEKREILPPDPDPEKPQYQTKIYSDTTKWQFFKLLDKDASVKRYANGYVVFASEKFGYRIIERYYEKNGIDLAKGVATYIMSENDWRKNQGILETVLISDKKNLEGAEVRNIVQNKDRIRHRTRGNSKTWMDEIANYFRVDFAKDTRYTDEELQQLHEFIEESKHDYLTL